jgi:hypothetical protein
MYGLQGQWCRGFSILRRATLTAAARMSAGRHKPEHLFRSSAFPTVRDRSSDHGGDQEGHDAFVEPFGGIARTHWMSRACSVISAV